MKKSVLFVAALALSASTVFAQDAITSKKGEHFLPESGDWSIGVDATPFLQYVGNMFNGSTLNNAPTWNFLNANQTIVGKMYSSDQMAYRGIVRIGMTSNTTKAQIADQSAAVPTYPNLPAMKEDKAKVGSHFVGLGGGMEWRKGKSRLQGFVGLDGMFWLSGSKSTYTYGNALSATMPVGANTTSFNSGANLTMDTYGNQARILEWKSGGTFGIGVRAFAGVEYFIVPKISIGAEFGWGVGYTMTGASSMKTESVGGAPASVGTQTITGNKTSGLMLDTDRNAFGTANGSLRMNFHFQ